MRSAGNHRDTVLGPVAPRLRGSSRAQGRASVVQNAEQHLEALSLISVWKAAGRLLRQLLGVGDGAEE